MTGVPDMITTAQSTVEAAGVSVELTPPWMVAFMTLPLMFVLLSRALPRDQGPDTRPAETDENATAMLRLTSIIAVFTIAIFVATIILPLL
ncbi:MULTISPECIES: hypothetical protein [Streptomyces]|uniref:hypothetical protein n=1 Tax=Streptomyces TaxID=1883 RepID=UPI0029A6E6B8|nr:hypothetical protein [Streptomyces sp. WI03-4A]MDX2591353.1 hypothetical protein [Streptomyces sp. WI03-4A]